MGAFSRIAARYVPQRIFCQGLSGQTVFSGQCHPRLKFLREICRVQPGPEAAGLGEVERHTKKCPFENGCRGITSFSHEFHIEQGYPDGKERNQGKVHPVVVSEDLPVGRPRIVIATEPDGDRIIMGMNDHRAGFVCNFVAGPENPHRPFLVPPSGSGVH